MASAVPRPAWLPERLFPFASGTTEAGGARVHHVDEGRGPVLLLLHGNPTWSFLWRDVISGLRDRFRCVAVDLPGFGLSAAPPGYGFTPREHAAVVEALVDALDLRDVTLVVQDWGGPVGFAVATRRPERFARLVVLNTWAWPMRRPDGVLFSKALGSTVGRRLIQQRNAFVEWVLPAGVRRGPLAPEVLDAYRGPFPTPASRLPTWVLPREITASAPFLAEVEHGLPALRDRPALILWPDGDPAFRHSDRRRWEGLLPDHRTVVVERAGHYVQEDAPDQLVAAIRDWWT
jgi:haloalkane dehalogenase